MTVMSVRNLESDLESLEVFDCPKLQLEQYYTPPKIAAEMLHAIDMDIGLSGKTVLDLGCGCGILGLGCANCGAAKVLGIDIDKAALIIGERNRDEVGLTNENMQYLQHDVLSLKNEDVPVDFQKVDMCVSNPPFGTWTKGLDLCFVRKGLEFCDVMYSIHKSTTHDFLIKKAKEMNVSIDFLFESKNFPIAKTYSFHKSLEKYIQVDIVKFERRMK